MKVIISHAQKQHAYRLVYALEKSNRLKVFFTAIFFSKKGIIKKKFST